MTDPMETNEPLFFPCTCSHSYHGHFRGGNFPSADCDSCNCDDYEPDHAADPLPGPAEKPVTEEEFVDRLVDISGPTWGSLIAVGLGLLSGSARLTNAGVHVMARNIKPKPAEPEACTCLDGALDPDCPQNDPFLGHAR